MSSKYPEVRIEDLIDEIAMGPFGSNIKAECFISHGVPVFNGSNLTGYTTNDDNLRFVSPEKAASLGNALASRGDVVVTHRGTLGQISYIPYDSQYEHYIISQSQFRLKCNKKVLPQYLVSYFHTREGQWKLLSNKTQTGVPALGRPTTSFKKLNIPLPPMETQRKIVKMVGSIREKIALNSRTNGYLAAVCESLAEKQQNTIVPLEGLCQQVNERTDFSEANFDSYISTESLLPEKMGRQTASSLPKSGKVTKYQAGDTLVSNIRPYFKKVWFADCNGTCSGDVIVFRARNASMSPYLYSLIRSDSFFEYVMLGSKGTKMPRGDKKQMMTYPVVASCAQADLQLITFCVHQLTKNARESVMLNELRDSLLPKLMSGEIDVSKVEVPTQPNSHLCEN